MRLNRILMNVIVISIMGLSICLMIKAISVPSDIQSNTIFVLELDRNILPGSRITTESLLSDHKFVRKSSVRHISAKTALETMKSDMPELNYLADNPFHDIIVFQTRDLKANDLDVFELEIGNLSGVSSLHYDRELLESLPPTFTRARIGLLSFSLIILTCISAT